MALITRFAPSPTGYLHLGHALSAMTGYEVAKREQGRFLLRIEDIDPERCRPEYETAIYEDLAWLGIEWETPIRRQSEHLAIYAAVLERLKASGVLYPCFCARKFLARLDPPPQEGPDGPIYPGFCRHLPVDAAAERLEAGEAANWRLDVQRAMAITGPLAWHDRLKGQIVAAPARFGDVVIGRKDIPTSYHLSVVVDDHLQNITLVTRGLDLFDATDIHRLLQALLGYGQPEYFHHPLIEDPETKWKLSKRDGSMGLRQMRAAGMTAADITERLGFSKTFFS